MATEYKLNYTAEEINERLGKVTDKMDSPTTASVG